MGPKKLFLAFRTYWMIPYDTSYPLKIFLPLSWHSLSRSNLPQNGEHFQKFKKVCSITILAWQNFLINFIIYLPISITLASLNMQSLLNNNKYFSSCILTYLSFGSMLKLIYFVLNVLELKVISVLNLVENNGLPEHS